MNSKLHAVADANGGPSSFFMTAGQVSDYKGAAALLDDLPKAQWLLGDRGQDADSFRDALQAKDIQPYIPGRKSRFEPVRYDKRRYRHRSRIEIMFGRLTDTALPPATTGVLPALCLGVTHCRQALVRLPILRPCDKTVRRARYRSDQRNR